MNGGHSQLFIAMLIMHLVSHGPVGDQPHGVSLTCERAGADGLPYQAVRLKVTIMNSSTTPLTLVGPFEAMVAVGKIDNAAESTAVRINSRIPYAATSRESYQSKHVLLDELIRLQRLVLKPGEVETLAFAVGDIVPGDACFPRPGTYVIHVTYRGHTSQILRQTCTIVVRKPQGEDADICRLLESNSALRTAMLSTLATRNLGLKKGPADRETIRQLEKIALKHPKSAYSDYARLALARIYIGGISNVGFAPDTAKEAAVALLEKIDYKNFPHAPSALILWHMIAAESDRAKIKKKLDEEFGDSFEWLAEQAEQLTPEDWDKLRKEAPVIRGPRRQTPK